MVRLVDRLVSKNTYFIGRTLYHLNFEVRTNINLSLNLNFEVRADINLSLKTI